MSVEVFDKPDSPSTQNTNNPKHSKYPLLSLTKEQRRSISIGSLVLSVFLVPMSFHIHFNYFRLLKKSDYELNKHYNEMLLFDWILFTKVMMENELTMNLLQLMVSSGLPELPETNLN